MHLSLYLLLVGEEVSLALSVLVAVVAIEQSSVGLLGEPFHLLPHFIVLLHELFVFVIEIHVLLMFVLDVEIVPLAIRLPLLDTMLVPLILHPFDLFDLVVYHLSRLQLVFVFLLLLHELVLHVVQSV